MIELKFNNFIFNKEMNYTVRLGRHHYDNLSPGQNILLIGPLENQRVKAHIKELIRCNFEGIARYVYKDEHDPICRDREGLIKVMQTSYGKEFNIDNNPEVTCIGFILVD
ncbi:MAG: hypothetical protein WC917_04640 [Bacilli bacterium]|jgi:hypothetical protein